MKVKACISKNAPSGLFVALGSVGFRAAVVERVFMACLNVAPKEIGPATHYVQVPDELVACQDGSLGCEITLSKVSMRPDRCPADFWKARRELQNLVAEVCVANLSKGRRIQVYAVISVNEKIRTEDGREDTLIEGDPIWVEGELDE